DRRLVHRLEVAGSGARGVDAEEGDSNTLLDRERDRIDDPLEHRLTIDAKRVELQIGDRRLDHARSDPELHESLDVGLDRARETPDLGIQACVADQLDGAPVVLRDTRKAGFDSLDPESVKPSGQPEAVVGGEDDAYGLLAVSERRVVEADLCRERMRGVERAGPECA